ncbi:hypothetical protein Glove_421g113 [Diversispora epigaea]|uniref:Uncharacterized protein n=1 Tax=Diversispora epigaea TaxID=1348612 RepID=A0A397GXB2_9GLOM|nr:hypothetical protein Glove_421g113 [Diversispora epigaea]
MTNNQLAINSLRVLEEHEIRITNLERIAREQAELEIAMKILDEGPIIEAQHRLHHTSWYKDIKKLEDIVNRDRQKRCMCQDNGIFLLEVWYDENPEIVIPERIQKIKEFTNQLTKSLDNISNSVPKL